LEAKLVQQGAVYSKGDNYTSYTVTDGNIITGQNPGSSVAMARKIIAYMKLNAPRVEMPILN
jgi:putative intracellular protease/amidase